MNFSRDDESKLCELISNHPALYDHGLTDFKDATLKDNIWKEIASSFIGKTDEDCKKRWRSIRDHYKRLKREGKLGTGSAARRAKIWPLLANLSFLTHVSEERRSLSNIPDIDQEDEDINITDNDDDTLTENQNIMGLSTSYNDDSQQIEHSPPTSNKDARLKLIETLNNKKVYGEEDDVDAFYKSIAISVKRLPPLLRAEAKMQHLQILNNLEMKNTQNEHQQLAYPQPPRPIDNTTIQTFNPSSFESYPPAHQQQGPQPPRPIDNTTIQTFNPSSFESYPPAYQKQGYYQL